MESLRSYKQRGSPDCPIEVYSSASRPPYNRVTHWHPELELTIVMKGESLCRMDKETIRAVPGDILVIAPGTIHEHRRATPITMAWTIVISMDAITMPEFHVFQREFVQPLQEGRLVMPRMLKPGDPLHTALFPAMSRLPECRLYSENYKMNRFSVAMNVCTTLARFCHGEAARDSATKQSHQAVKECMRYIHRNYHEPLTIAFLAEHVHLQENYLCALFKEHTGQTVMEHLTRIRVDAAAFLLRNNDLPTSRVAELCGFRSESVFFRRFKEIMGTTPKAYQKQQTAQNQNR